MEELKKYQYLFFKYLFFIILILIGFYIVKSLKVVILPLLFSYLIAFTVNPVIDFLEKKGIGRVLSTVIFLVVFTVIIVYFLVVFIPKVLVDFGNFFSKFPAYFNYLYEKAKEFAITQSGMQFEELLKILKDKISENASSIAKGAGGVLIHLFSSMLSFFAFLLQLILVPIFIYYFLVYFHKINEAFLSFVPQNKRKKFLAVMARMESMMSGFIRGQLIACLILWIFYSIFLLIVGVPYAIIVGFIAGMLNLIPYLGLFIGILIADMVAFFEIGTLNSVIYVTAGILIIHTVEDLLIFPKIVGDKVGLNSLLVIVGILAGGTVGGILGIIFAIPVLAGFKILLEIYVLKRDIIPRDESEAAESTQA